MRKESLFNQKNNNQSIKPFQLNDTLNITEKQKENQSDKPKNQQKNVETLSKELAQLKNEFAEFKKKVLPIVQEHQLCMKQNMLLEKIKNHINLEIFYRAMYCSLNNFFLACKTLSTEYVERASYTLSDKVEEIAEKFALTIPGVGMFVPLIGLPLMYLGDAIKSFELFEAILPDELKKKVKESLNINSEIERLQRIATLSTTLTESDRLAGKIALLITICYRKQIKQLKKKSVPKLAEFAQERVALFLREGEYNEKSDISSQVLTGIALENITANPCYIFKKRLITKAPQKDWTEDGIFRKTGVRFFNNKTKSFRYYVNDDSNVEKYGYRDGMDSSMISKLHFYPKLNVTI